jgi:squalene-hopene/tetraprenyl-beta-curcumene cyclase
MRSIFAAFLVCWSTAVIAAEPVTLETAADPGPNQKDEAIRAAFSLDQATQFLDSAALTWQKKRQCFTCHTNYAYLYARPLISADAQAHREVRQFAEQLVTERWEKSGPRWDAEVVATGAALAFNDRATTGKLHTATRTALDRMWKVQKADGGFDWIKCDWPPMESDDHYGATLAAIAAGVAPEKYAEGESAKAGLAKLKDYLAANPGPMLHHRAMTLWASSYHPGWLAREKQQSTIDELLKLQKADGGWCAATLGDWKRGDGTEQDLKTSDAYATGFVIYVLRRAGLAADDARLAKGVAWLKKNQRASGRWYTRSLHSDSMHFLSHAGTSFAIMALAECNQLK